MPALERPREKLAPVGVLMLIGSAIFVVLAEAVLFVVLLSVFERSQLQNAVEKANLLGELAMELDRVRASADAERAEELNRILQEQPEKFGMHNVGYKSYGNAASYQFTSSKPAPDPQEIVTADMEKLWPGEHFFNAMSRLLWTGDKYPLVSNADLLLPQAVSERVAGSAQDRLVIKTVLLVGGDLRADTLDFIGVYFLQASILVLIVAGLMYYAGNRLVGIPLQKQRERLWALARYPLDSPGGANETPSSVREIALAEEGLGELTRSLQDKGAEFFREYRGRVEHDIANDLSLHSRVAEEIGQSDDAGLRAMLAQVLVEMQRYTSNYLKDIFSFISPEAAFGVRQSFELRAFVSDLLCMNILLHVERTDLDAAAPGSPDARVSEIRELRASLIDHTGASPAGTFLAAKASCNVPEGLRIDSNRAALTSAIGNLVMNSVKSLRSSGAKVGWDKKIVEVGAREHNGSIEIWVRDNGPGCPSGAAIGTAAATGGSTRTGDGWGMGLEIVKERCRQLGGKLVQPKDPVPPLGSPTAGAEFKLVFPKS